MAYNDNERKRTRSSNKDYALKLAFEARLIKKVRRNFNKYNNSFFRTYLEFGYPASVAQHKLEMLNILQQHYDRVSDAFSQQIVKKLGKPENHTDVRQDVELETELHKVIRADTSAQQIAQTTQKNAHDSINEVLLEAAALGIFLSRKKVAQKARLRLKKKLTGRLTTIGISNTNNPAEYAKQTEATSLINRKSILPVGAVAIHRAKPDKTWSTKLDDLVRLAHAQAEGQRVPVDEPYTVNGESLMYPGDDSLGASIENTINCRCTSIISF